MKLAHVAVATRRASWGAATSLEQMLAQVVPS